MTERFLNLGCGTDHITGAVNVDISPAVDPDIVLDINDVPWPFPKDRFETVKARHVLEHTDDFEAVLAEISRVLRPEGVLRWTYPIGHTRFEDTTHTQFWNYNSAEFQCGERGEHAHEVASHWNLENQTFEWHISQPEPLVYIYTKYRLLVSGPGPWLEQIPGLAGEMRADLRYSP